MLSIIHMNGYQNFLTIFIELEIKLKPAIAQALPVNVKNCWQEAHQYFQTHLENCLDPESLDPEMETETYHQWTSLHTEIKREVRLLNTDFLFWQSARQPKTQLARQTSCWQRSQKLIRYCQMILEL